MASVMIRPTVVRFLDVMLRGNENLRIEQVSVPNRLTGRSLSSLDLQDYPNILLLAVKNPEDYIFNPSRSYQMRDGDELVMMTSPADRRGLEKFLERLN